MVVVLASSKLQRGGTVFYFLLCGLSYCCINETYRTTTQRYARQRQSRRTAAKAAKQQRTRQNDAPVQASQCRVNKQNVCEKAPQRAKRTAVKIVWALCVAVKKSVLHHRFSRHDFWLLDRCERVNRLNSCTCPRQPRSARRARRRSTRARHRRSRRRLHRDHQAAAAAAALALVLLFFWRNAVKK